MKTLILAPRDKLMNENNLIYVYGHFENSIQCYKGLTDTLE